MSKVSLMKCDVLECDAVAEQMPRAVIQLDLISEHRLNVCTDHVEEIFGEAKLYKRRTAEAREAVEA